MKQHVLIHKKTNKRLMLFEDRDFEMKNPIEHYGNQTIVKQMILNGISKEEMNGDKELTAMNREIFRNALDHWLKLKGEFQKIKVPKNLIQLLKTNRKRDQEKLLDGFILTPEILTSFIFTAYHEFGYTLSQYSAEFSQKDLNTIKMPNAKIMDCGKHWHCFFTAFNSLRGEETRLGKKEGRLYYMSNVFGIDRVEVVKQIKSGGSKLGCLPYITLEPYGHSWEVF